MAWAELLPHFPHLQIQSIQQESQHITITLVSTREGDRCPTCQTQTLAGHGWFSRRIQSLPCLGQAVVLLIQAGRFRCPNPACPRKTFREDLSALADRYQRRTQAASQLLCSVAAIAGGQAVARLAAQMQFPINRSTLLRCLVRHASCPEDAPQVVGVDDFAWTKRRRYGTILVNLYWLLRLSVPKSASPLTLSGAFPLHLSSTQRENRAAHYAVSCPVFSTDSQCSQHRRMRWVLVNVGRFTCRLRTMSCWRKKAFSAMSSDLLRPRSLRVDSGWEVLSGLLQ